MIVFARRRFAFIARASLMATATVLGACGQDSPDDVALTASAEQTVSTITMGAITARLVIVNDWGAGYQASVRLQNTGADTTSWQTAITMNGSTVSSSFNIL